jgi:uncharacterized membrane protein YphA (DoxX/SURF4 family)
LSIAREACRSGESRFVAPVNPNCFTGETAMSHTITTSQSRRNVWKNASVWTLQVLVAGLFMYAGVMKLILPIEAMTQQMPLPGLFLRFIGVCEALGAVGLIVPAALRIRPGLTPLAAALLVPIMIGATVISAMIGGISAGTVPFVVGLVCTFIAVYRGKTLVRTTRRPASILQTAG